LIGIKDRPKDILMIRGDRQRGKKCINKSNYF